MTYMQHNLAFAGGIQELSLEEIGFVGGGDIGDDYGSDGPWGDVMLGQRSQRDRCIFTMTPNMPLGQGGTLTVGCTYVRGGDQPINVTVVSRNSDGSYQVRNNDTGNVSRFTPAGGS